MHGGRKHGIEVCEAKSWRRPRHTRGNNAKEEKEILTLHIWQIPSPVAGATNTSSIAAHERKLWYYSFTKFAPYETILKTKNTVPWDVALCNLISIYWHSEGISCLHLQGRTRISHWENSQYLIHSTWRWRPHVPLKCQQSSTRLYGITS